MKWEKERKVEWHYIAPGKPKRDSGSLTRSTVGYAQAFCENSRISIGWINPCAEKRLDRDGRSAEVWQAAFHLLRAMRP
jgi:hypothetical protein